MLGLSLLKFNIEAERKGYHTSRSDGRWLHLLIVWNKSLSLSQIKKISVSRTMMPLFGFYKGLAMCFVSTACSLLNTRFGSNVN